VLETSSTATLLGQIAWTGWISFDAMPDQYALATDRRTDRQKEGQKDIKKPPLCGGGLK